MDGSAYRDCSDLVAAELSRLVNERRIEMASTPQGRQSIYVRRMARVAFGVVGTIGAAATVIVTVADKGYGASMLLSAWLLASLAWVVARVVASLRLRRHLNQELELSGDSFADTTRLREFGPREKEAELAQLRADESIAWPLTAVALLGPLTIHLMIGLFFQMRLSEFEEWMQLSGIVVGLSHLYMVRVAWLYPKYRHPWKGLMRAIAVGLPGAMILCGSAGSLIFVLYGFPVAAFIILVTGSVLIWGAYEPLGALLDRERAWLEVE